MNDMPDNSKTTAVPNGDLSFEELIARRQEIDAQLAAKAAALGFKLVPDKPKKSRGRKSRAQAAE
jgi:hypothetical protein